MSKASKRERARAQMKREKAERMSKPGALSKYAAKVAARVEANQRESEQN